MNTQDNVDSNKKYLELEAQLIEQDHRWVSIFYTYLVRRKTFPQGDPRRDASLRAVLWRIFSPQSAALVGVGIASFLGLYLAYKANLLLSQQNAKIDIQNQLAEASRRASLIGELTSINERIDFYREKNDEVTLPKSLMGRVIALSKSLRPYQYISYQSDDISSFGDPFSKVSVSDESIKLVSRALSPERGQLLLTLISANIKNFDEMMNAGNGAEFRNADLRGVTLRSSKLQNVDLQFADFSGANLFNMDFEQSDMEEAVFEGASLIGVKFVGASLGKASFHGARLNKAVFTKASLSDADFSDALLFDVTFGDAVVNADFEGAIFCQKTINADTECENLLRKGIPSFLDSSKWQVAEEKVENHAFADAKEIHFVIRNKSAGIKD